MYSNSQRAIRSADGRLWFIGARGVSLIDPPSMTQPPFESMSIRPPFSISSGVYGSKIGRGGSAILAPDGSYLAGPAYDEETILYAELDPARLWEERQRFDPAGHYHRPDVLQLSVTPRG